MYIYIYIYIYKYKVRAAQMAQDPSAAAGVRAQRRALRFRRLAAVRRFETRCFCLSVFAQTDLSIYAPALCVHLCGSQGRGM